MVRRDTQGKHGIAIHAQMRFKARDHSAADTASDDTLIATECPNVHRANAQLKAFLVGRNVELASIRFVEDLAARACPQRGP